MKQLYKSLFTLGLTLIISVGMSTAQRMNGNYTIDRTASASSTNFTSFRTAVSALSSRGVDGPVTFEVHNGPYTEQVTLRQITGASATNRITFKGNMETLQFSNTSSTGAVVRLDGADYITFDSLKVIGTGTSGYARCFRIWNRANYNEITNCELQIPSVSTTLRYSAYIWVSAGTTSPFNYNDHARDLLIKDNYMHGNDAGTRGPYYGVVLFGRTTNSAGSSNNILDGNEITDFYYYGVYTYYNTSPRFLNNYIHNTNSTRANRFCYGLFVQRSFRDIYVDGNRIVHIHSPRVVSQTTTRYQYPLYLYNFNNGNMYVRNNIIMNSANYYNLNYIYNWGSFTCNIDNNTFTSPDLGNNNTYTFDFGNRPLYGGYWTNVRNNIFHMEQPGTGTKCIIQEFANGGTGPNFENNFWDIENAPGSVVAAQLVSGRIDDVDDFLTGPGGEDSRKGEIALRDLGDGFYQPTSFNAANMAMPISGITTDIAGVTRNTSSPDVGAMEYFIDVTVAGMNLQGADGTNNSYECGNYSESVSITVRNNGTDTISGVPVMYEGEWRDG
jgi:hypothetical protein